MTTAVSEMNQKLQDSHGLMATHNQEETASNLLPQTPFLRQTRQFTVIGRHFATAIAPS